ncbi:ZIP family metal transporter [Pseudonocardia sp. KRD-182]|nr:ZIP family metal transporter [Pseudonocardia oceani]
MPVWLLGLAVTAVIGLVLGLLAVFGGSTLPDRAGPPIEELAVERTVLSPGAIELTVRNIGPDPVQVSQVFVNDSFVTFTGGGEPLERLRTTALDLDYPWSDGTPYVVSLLTSTGLVIEHEIAAAVTTPPADADFYGRMVLIGTYVGIIPVLLGMLFLPVLRRVGGRSVQVLLALSVGVLAFLAVDATFEGFELAAGGTVFGGGLLVILGAAFAYLVLMGVDRWQRSRTAAARRVDSAGGMRLALLIAIGIGLHNLAEGLVIGSAYAVGELALGAALIMGFVINNVTEGVAIVAPLADRRPTWLALLGLGLVAGVPAILGAVIGGAVNNPALAAVLFGLGVGAILQVVVQILPSLREPGTRAFDSRVLGGLTLGVLLMYGTSLFSAA